MTDHLGSLARFERVQSVRQVDHLVIDNSWYLVGLEALPVMVRYNKEIHVVEFFPDQAGSDISDMPHGVVRLTGEEFLSVLVWLIRRGLLEDVELVSTETPTPGSDKAIALGCICPVLDNGHGRGHGDGTFWIIEGCPLHGKFASAAIQNARKKAGIT